MPMMPPLEVPPLGVPEEEAQRRFEALQERLVPLWERIRSINENEQTIVVLPSCTFEFDLQGAEGQAYEERMLFMMLLLRQPRARMVYVTSQTILPATLDYYVSLMPGVVNHHAMARFHNVALEDRSDRPLTIKLLERPHVLEHIRSLVPDPRNAHLVAFNVTRHERDVALRLGIPIYGADPKYWDLGSKSGAREIFERAGARHPFGVGGMRSVDDVRAALARMRADRPDAAGAVVKLDQGVSGEGNAFVDLEGLPPAGSPDAEAALDARLREMSFESASVTYERFFEKLVEGGGIVEERIVGDDFRSPSVQMRVTPLGTVEVLSTHDQMLGGPKGQSFLGSRFPADPEYAVLLGREARKIGTELAKEGVLGRFAVDFVVVRGRDGTWQSFAIEINLRKGGTTHPFLILQFLTDGTYDEEEGAFRAPDGHAKHYVSSDHIEDTLYHALTPSQLLDILIRHGLQFDQARQTGVLAHMLASLAENGRFGVVAVGNSPEQAQALYEQVQAVTRTEARASIEPRPLPTD